MTNYNERLNDELERLYRIAADTELAADRFDPYAFNGVTEAKQAITSLIKELVAEAKPKTMPSNLSPENYEKCERVVNQYHQNLLKALEE